MKSVWKRFAVPASLSLALLMGIPITWIGGHDWVLERSTWNADYAALWAMAAWFYMTDLICINSRSGE